ncbi:vWA domain-containing protein [Psychroflexus planctonicus]|uniref:BatA protein n=1 Tax=Psychroflexus planctonicus TaxID=1526575 RepID=A0ABQ1SHB7_9FLAO|nr:VWA domain-containing protein [Psychroflexus planctonicus]GGE34024.1 BatA protein [Psychroflexus planctonicus]
MWQDVFFENPEWFWLLLLLPLLGAWHFIKRNKENPVVHISSINGFANSKSILPKLRPVLYVLRLLALGLFIVAMARPRTVDVTSQIKGTEGIDIVIAADISTSMLAQDFKPNRLEALKEVAAEFVDRRKTDRIGVVIYAGESYTKTPLTSDKALVKNAIKDIDFTDAIDGGTAIGMGIATSVNRLKESNAESKVIILLTDGVNNSGFIDPEIATELAMEYDIKIYSIGIGTQGRAMSPVRVLSNGQFEYRPVEVEIDEELLTRISNETGGKYYRATNQDKLAEIYEEIDALEKTEIEEEKFYDYEEKFKPIVILGLGLLLFEFILRNTLFRSFV